jgi:hypothetical protein
MKKKQLLFLFIILLSSSFIQSEVFSQVLISENNGSPHSSAMLEIQSDARGVLIPRLTSEERTGISLPAEGLLVYDSDLRSFFIFRKKSG